MTLDQARKIISEIHERYKIGFSEVQEKRENGQIKSIYVTLKFKLESVQKESPQKKSLTL